MEKIFITGIGTNVGKTIVAAIVTEALKADYWKPVQSGDLDNSDTSKVKQLVSNKTSVFHDETFKLNQPLSPHASAKIDGIKINLNDFQLPTCSKTYLVIEGAGGLMVPINHQGDLIIDLINHLKTSVILVSQNYLGSINHTLLSIEELKRRKINILGIIFNGDRTPETEDFIENYSKAPILLRINQESAFTQELIKNYAQKFLEAFKHFYAEQHTI